MLTDSELDELQRDFIANGWTWSGKFAEVVAQGNPRDAGVAAEALEATNDGVKT